MVILRHRNEKPFTCNICCALYANARAQRQIPLNETHYLGSLQHVLKSKQADSNKCDANYLLCYHWRSKDTVKSKAYLISAEKLAANNPYYQTLYFFMKGNTIGAAITYIQPLFLKRLPKNFLFSVQSKLSV